jgi:hypothetical protein
VKRLLAVLLAAFIFPAIAAEEIRDFSSRIEVLPDSDLIVTEIIRVMPEGNKIKRGISRSSSPGRRGSSKRLRRERNSSPPSPRTAASLWAPSACSPASDIFW